MLPHDHKSPFGGFIPPGFPQHSAVRLVGRNTLPYGTPRILWHARVADEYLDLPAFFRLRRPNSCMPENRLHVRHVAALRTVERPDAELPSAAHLVVEFHRPALESNDQHRPAP
ncbi:hypothetical protein [Pseudomonas phage vB_Pae_CF124b]|nr:hypothetical protein [Pseudomonas phage vB_Pae_CF124b]